MHDEILNPLNIFIHISPSCSSFSAESNLKLTHLSHPRSSWLSAADRNPATGSLSFSFFFVEETAQESTTLLFLIEQHKKQPSLGFLVIVGKQPTPPDHHTVRFKPTAFLLPCFCREEGSQDHHFSATQYKHHHTSTPHHSMQPRTVSPTWVLNPLDLLTASSPVFIIIMVADVHHHRRRCSSSSSPVFILISSPVFTSNMLLSSLFAHKTQQSKLLPPSASNTASRVCFSVVQPLNLHCLRRLPFLRRWKLLPLRPQRPRRSSQPLLHIFWFFWLFFSKLVVVFLTTMAVGSIFFAAGIGPDHCRMVLLPLAFVLKSFSSK